MNGVCRTLIAQVVESEWMLLRRWGRGEVGTTNSERHSHNVGVLCDRDN